MVGTRIEVFVHLPHGLDAADYRERYLVGDEPDETPYGFHLARELGFNVTFSRDHKRWRNDWLRHRIKRLLFGIDLVHAFDNRAAIRRADVVWTMLEGEAFSVGLLFFLRLTSRRPLIGNVVWLFNEWHATRFLKRALHRLTVRCISKMTVHSASCLPVAKSAFPGVDVRLMHFGISLNTFPIREPRAESAAGPLHVFAAGNDGTRDWQTLLHAFGNDARFRLTIVCWWLDPSAIEPYNNVVLVTRPTMAAFRSLYDEADVVAVPMTSNLFSGITVALESAALGRPLLATRTGGVPTYFADDEVTYVEPNDPSGMRDALLTGNAAQRIAASRRAQRRLIDAAYTTAGLIGRYADLTRELLAPPR